MARRKETWTARYIGVTSSYVAENVTVLTELRTDNERKVALILSDNQAASLRDALSRMLEKKGYAK